MTRVAVQLRSEFIRLFHPFIFEAGILSETLKMEIKNIISWVLSCLNVDG